MDVAAGVASDVASDVEYDIALSWMNVEYSMEAIALFDNPI